MCGPVFEYSVHLPIEDARRHLALDLPWPGLPSWRETLCSIRLITAFCRAMIPIYDQVVQK
jgi:hypothetical protein